MRRVLAYQSALPFGILELIVFLQQQNRWMGEFSVNIELLRFSHLYGKYEESLTVQILLQRAHLLLCSSVLVPF